MSPIRVGLIGLSASTEFNWAAEAHLPYLKSTPYYAIVALANSSVQSAKAAIEWVAYSFWLYLYADLCIPKLL